MKTRETLTAWCRAWCRNAQPLTVRGAVRDLETRDASFRLTFWAPKLRTE